jgi:dipeptidyl aminopeptidase/acylaminoacyl peptidase
MKRLIVFLFLVSSTIAFTQDRMTPELLWKLGRVSSGGLTRDKQNIYFTVAFPDASANRSTRKYYTIPVKGGEASEVTDIRSVAPDRTVSPDGKYKIIPTKVKLTNVFASDFYEDLPKANAMIYESLNYRHWDTWEDGAYSHLFVHPVVDGKTGEGKDIMAGELHDCPLKPFGGEEDFTWSPDSKKIIYTTKKKSGTAYATSTNTDLYEYDLATGTTTNISEGMMGYDTEPAFSSNGQLAWLSMKRDGFESDKNDIIVRVGTVKVNLTQHWDGTVSHFKWSNDGKKIYFIAPIQGTVQLFEVDNIGLTKKMPVVKQITKGDFDISSLAGQVENTLFVTRTDMNHAGEIYTVDLTNGQMKQVSHVNDSVYNKIALSKIEKRWVGTTDGKQMLVWVIYPPDFDPAKKYPTLLYCQGGPQSALSQIYSFRWNFQLMAAHGYIVVAPNRRGMPGHGVAWNEQVSKDHGGQSIQDYLSAIDALSNEPFVDKTRLGCVGPSYGGYSVYYLAGVHNKRFKSFIAHDGIFNTKSMYGTTEELFFVDWDYGGPYWDKNNAAAQKAYTTFDPSSLVDKWDAPILIYQGGKDFRVPDGQAFEAFQAAQLRGIKSRLVYLPEENHWVLSAQNALLWQREFYKWLKETL